MFPGLTTPNPAGSQAGELQLLGAACGPCKLDPNRAAAGFEPTGRPGWGHHRRPLSPADRWLGAGPRAAVFTSHTVKQIQRFASRTWSSPDDRQPVRGSDDQRWPAWRSPALLDPLVNVASQQPLRPGPLARACWWGVGADGGAAAAGGASLLEWAVPPGTTRR